MLMNDDLYDVYKLEKAKKQIQELVKSVFNVFLKKGIEKEKQEQNTPPDVANSGGKLKQTCRSFLCIG